jgi:sortase A
MTWTNGRTRPDHRTSARNHRRYDRWVRRAIAGIGRALVTVGILILLFVVYQLWGTGVFTARAQDHLKSDFERQIQEAESHAVRRASTTVKPGATTTTTIAFSHRVAPLTTQADGDAEGWIQIPAINVGFYYVEGTSRDDLKKGPGHYPLTPLPGTLGNAGIAGHRTTYLHPFGDLDKLHVGDDIIITTLKGTVFDYKVSTPPFDVYPTDVWVVANTPDPELTLTACTPKGSAAQRIVVKAKLATKQSAPPTQSPKLPITRSTSGSGKGRSSETTLVEGLSGQQRSLKPSIAWGIIVAVVGLMWWWAFRRWRHPRTWLVGVLPFLIALIPFYVYLERALPSGY